LIDVGPNTFTAEEIVSIVRQGLSEDSKFAAGYEAIFGKKTGTAKAAKKPAAKKATARKSTAKKK
jgi:hypothetical protein